MRTVDTAIGEARTEAMQDKVTVNVYSIGDDYHYTRCTWHGCKLVAIVRSDGTYTRVA